MNQRLNLEQAVQFVLRPGSASELSELSDIDDTEEDEIYEKSQQSARIISIFCFSFTVLFAFSLLLFCLFSVVHHTQKFNLKLSPLIDLVINICPGKMWLFYLKLEVNMVFLWAGSSTFPLVSLFHEFWFLLFQ